MADAPPASAGGGAGPDPNGGILNRLPESHHSHQTHPAVPAGRSEESIILELSPFPTVGRRLPFECLPCWGRERERLLARPSRVSSLIDPSLFLGIDRWLSSFVTFLN